MTGETILVVEDEGLIALHMTELLEKAGYRVIGTEYAGEVVLRKLGTSPLPDLILMDIALAGSVDGIETARQIQKRFSIPIIFVTAYTSDRLVERMRGVASDGVLLKPFMDDELLLFVRKSLTKTTE